MYARLTWKNMLVMMAKRLLLEELKKPCKVMMTAERSYKKKL